MIAKRYRNETLPTWEVVHSNGKSWWIAVKLANGDWSISNGFTISPVNPSGTLGRKIIKAITNTAESTSGSQRA